MLQCHHLVTVKDLILQVLKMLNLKKFSKTPLTIQAEYWTDVGTELVMFIAGFWLAKDQEQFKEWAVHLLFLSFSSFATSVLPTTLWILNKLNIYVWLHIACEGQFASLWCPKVFLWEPWGAGLEKAFTPSAELPLGRTSRASHNSQNPHQKLKIFTDEIPNISAIPFELYTESNATLLGANYSAFLLSKHLKKWERAEVGMGAQSERKPR